MMLFHAFCKRGAALGPAGIKPILPNAVFVGVLALTSSWMGAGCEKRTPLPQTYPAIGTVVYKGGRPMKGGNVAFNSAEDPLLRVIGEIAEDGSFTLRTVKENSFTQGAPAGEYQVVVTPALVADPKSDLPFAHHGVPPISLPAPYKIEAKEDNVLKVELPVPPPAN